MLQFYKANSINLPSLLNYQVHMDMYIMIKGRQVQACASKATSHLDSIPLMSMAPPDPHTLSPARLQRRSRWTPRARYLSPLLPFLQKRELSFGAKRDECESAPYFLANARPEEESGSRLRLVLVLISAREGRPGSRLIGLLLASEAAAASVSIGGYSAVAVRVLLAPYCRFVDDKNRENDYEEE